MSDHDVKPQTKYDISRLVFYNLMDLAAKHGYTGDPTIALMLEYLDSKDSVKTDDERDYNLGLMEFMRRQLDYANSDNKEFGVSSDEEEEDEEEDVNGGQC